MIVAISQILVVGPPSPLLSSSRFRDHRCSRTVSGTVPAARPSSPPPLGRKSQNRRPAMKAAFSMVLAASLVTLPITQALAQAAPQDSPTAETSLVPEERSRPVLGAPALTPERALLWQPIAESRGRPSLSDPAPAPGWDDWSKEKRVWVVGGIFVGLVVLGVVSIG